MQLDLLRRTMNPGYPLTPEMDLEIHFVASASVGSLEWWIQNDRPLSPEEMARKMLLIHRKLPWYNNEN